MRGAWAPHILHALRQQRPIIFLDRKSNKRNHDREGVCRFSQNLTLIFSSFMHYFIYEQECFISDKARIASILNSFKNDLFYTHLVSLFAKEFSIYIDVVLAEKFEAKVS